MTKLLSFAVVPLLTLTLVAQEPATDPTRHAAVEQSDREFLADIEQQKPAPVVVPAPPSVAVAPAPAVVSRPAPARPETVTRIATVPPKEKKTTVSSSRSQPAKVRPASRARPVTEERVYRGILVNEAPEEGARVEKRLPPKIREMEVRRPIRVIKTTITTVTTRTRNEDDEEDD